MRVRHILVSQLFQAEDLERQLQEGADFEVLALRHSSCPSAQIGGDLGHLTKKWDKLEENFREACEKLQVGSISRPVRTRFGYHLIQRYE